MFKRVVTTAFLMIGMLHSAIASEDNAKSEIEAALTEWTADFNARRADKICALFAPDVRADVAGRPERDYDALCNLLTRSLRDTTRSYTYTVEIKEILVFGQVAVVRLVWMLAVKNKEDGRESTSVEPGMDLFRKQSDGAWRIIRYMAY